MTRLEYQRKWRKDVRDGTRVIVPRKKRPYIPTGHRYCSHCGTVKELKEFYVSRRDAEGHSRFCKVCQDGYRKPRTPAQSKKYKLATRFGMTPKEYADLLAKQGGVCAICGGHEIRTHRSTGQVVALSVDHDHQTGKVRGLLCYRCNLGLGVFEATCKKYAQYLKETA